MVNDKTYRRLLMSVKREKNIEIAATKCGICDKTARKYLKAGKPPSELKKQYVRTIKNNPFKYVWNESIEFLELNPGLEAKSLFEYLQKKYPGKYQDGQLRTYQRKMQISFLQPVS